MNPYAGDLLCEEEGYSGVGARSRDEIFGNSNYPGPPTSEDAVVRPSNLENFSGRMSERIDFSEADQRCLLREVMDPLTIIAAAVALVFASLWLVGLRSARSEITRANEKIKELEDMIRELKSVPVSEPARSDKAQRAKPKPDRSDEARGAESTEPKPEPESKPKAEPESKPKAEPEPKPAGSDEARGAESTEPKPEAKAEPEVEPAEDRLRPLAAKVVSEAYEMCRYLDFDALVDADNPRVYRTTMKLTAVNAEVLRYLEAGMFPCLTHYEIRGDTAIFHIDTSRGMPRAHV